MSSWVCAFVCVWASTPTASVAYAWMAEAALCTMIGEYWGGWAKPVEKLPHLIGLLLKSKSYATCYVSTKYRNLGWCEGKWSMKWAAECHQETLQEKRGRQRERENMRLKERERATFFNQPRRNSTKALLIPDHLQCFILRMFWGMGRERELQQRSQAKCCSS